MNNKHICDYYEGKIKDVTIRRSKKTIHCRRCGKELKREEVNPKIYKKISIIFDKENE